MLLVFSIVGVVFVAAVLVLLAVATDRPRS